MSQNSVDRICHFSIARSSDFWDNRYIQKIFNETTNKVEEGDLVNGVRLNNTIQETIQ